MYGDSQKVKYSREDMQRMDSVDMSKMRFDREEIHER